jgi:hypothetical protein
MGLPIDPSFKEPHIKGSVIRSARDWIIKTYGQEMFDRAVARIPGEMRSVIAGELLSVGWYPLVTWTTFMDSARREVTRTTGEAPEEFDRKNIFEAGRNTLLKVYRFMMGFMDPAGAVEKLLPVLKRIYSHGDIEILSHERGRLVLRFFDAPLSMQGEVVRQFPLSCEFMLHLASQRVTKITPTLRVDGNTVSYQLDIEYQKA